MFWLKAKSKAIAVSPQQPSDIDGLLATAVQNNVSMEMLERLFALREKLKAEQAQEAFYRALSGFQGECPVIKKTKKVMNKDGSTVRYTYAPAEQIERQTAGLRAKYGLSHTFNGVYKDGLMFATCTIHHVGGHSEESPFGVPIDKDAYMNNQQQVASARTFSNRYALLNGYGITTGDVDDDGNALGDPLPTATNIPEEMCREVHDKTLEYLESKDTDGMRKLWAGFDADHQAILWRQFTSAQRTAIKKLQKRETP